MQTHHLPPKPGAVVKGKICSVLCTGVKPSPPVSPPLLSQPNSYTAAFFFGSAVLFFPASMTILWLTSNSQCSCLSLLLPLLSLACLLPPYQGLCISALYCFLHSEVPSVFAAFVFSLSCYTPCSAVSYSHGVAVFHVPNDCSSLLESCLLKHGAPTSKSEIKMSWLDWENLENRPPWLMKEVCPGH